MRKVVSILTGEIVDDLSLLPEPIVDTTPYNELIDRETFRRLNLPFMFQVNLYDRDSLSLQRIIGAGSLAGFAIIAGALVGNLRWHGGSSDFSWITAMNNIVTMDAHTMFAFSKAAAEVESFLVFRGRYLKDNPIDPELIQLDITWQ